MPVVHLLYLVEFLELVLWGMVVLVMEATVVMEVLAASVEVLEAEEEAVVVPEEIEVLETQDKQVGGVTPAD